MTKWKTKNNKKIEEGKIMTNPQTEELTEKDPVEELPKNIQYELWLDAATADIFGKAVYFGKTMNEIMNAIADKATEAAKVTEQ